MLLNTFTENGSVHSQNLALTVLHVPNSLDGGGGGEETCREKVEEICGATGWGNRFDSESGLD